MGIYSEPTLLDFDADSPVTNGRQTTQSIDTATQQEHQPEPPASPAVSIITHEDSHSASVPKVDNKAGAPSANRLSISYARSNRRLVVNAEVVETLKLFRHEGRIEALIKVQKQEDGNLKGILVSFLSCEIVRRLLIGISRVKDCPRLPNLTWHCLLLLRNLLTLMRLYLHSSKQIQRVYNFLYILILHAHCQSPNGPKLATSRIGLRACLDECFGLLAMPPMGGRKKFT